MPKKRPRGWVWDVVSVVLPLLGTFGGAQLISWGVRESGERQVQLYWLGCLALVIAVGITAAAKIVDFKRGVLADDAKRTQVVRLKDELMPFASTMAEMAIQPHSVRLAYLMAVSKTAANALRNLVGEHVARPRAVVYMLDADANPVIMDPVGHSGRGERPGPFRAGTPRGDFALQFLNRRKTMHFADLNKKKPNGYDGSMAGYRTFVAAPIWTETGVYGMVTLDAPTPKAFDEGDVALVELTAEMMSIAFEIGQDQDATGH
ncbi:GAF domain-containing protein [Tersicoccus sp. Bi-70]|uniref:GAF domain-containing protein n=1 Tax=Tersicoccus sp. Bi-70 TaxID=1897634 RepID=UPI00117D6662|nr:GAF domain-containing protein [Tersicoccus sp. Bi-70]